MTAHALENERLHLASLLEAIQCCVYFLAASDHRLTWPLTAACLNENKNNIELFETLAAVNKRFAKLQNTMDAAMRHARLLAGEPGETFLKVLSFYEKGGVIDSVAAWQLCRTTRNPAAHDSETEYTEIAEHFNSLHTLIPTLYGNANRFLNYCATALDMSPNPGHFVDDFVHVMNSLASDVR